MIGPRRIGTPSRDIDITGYFMPCIDRKPIFVMLPGTTNVYLPIFSSETKLREMMILSKTSFETI